MTRTVTLPPLLVAIATYAADQPDINQLGRALRAARDCITTIQSPQGGLAREETRQRFIREEGEDARGLEGVSQGTLTAAQVCFGDPAFLYGLACAWLFLAERDGVR